MERLRLEKEIVPENIKFFLFNKIIEEMNDESIEEIVEFFELIFR